MMMRKHSNSPLFPYTTLFRSLQRNEARIVQVGSNDDSFLTPCDCEQFVVRRLSESEIDGVDRIMTGSPKMRPSIGRHRHVDQELQPVSSMISSSARLAA